MTALEVVALAVTASGVAVGLLRMHRVTIRDEHRADLAQRAAGSENPTENEAA